MVVPLHAASAASAAAVLEIDAARRRLWRGGQGVEVGDRAFDLLLALAQRPGDVVSADDLMLAAWPGRVVEPQNLRVQISQLRRQLGAEAIENVPGRGYRLAADLRAVGAPAARVLHGRDDDLRLLSLLVGQHRLVTVVGAGGIGKTSLVRVWHDGLTLGPAQGRGWADLAALDDVAGLPDLIALALGLAPAAGRAGWSAAGIAAALPEGRTLRLVLDNAEHLAPDVAAVADALLTAAPHLALVVTSQVPLRLPHEQVLRLTGLAVPEPGAPPGAARQAAAVALFNDRARAADPAFALVDAQVDQVAEVCRRVDGLPLAIELLAARVPSIGVAGLIQSLDDRLTLLDQQPRSGPSRQRTLRAALDWTHTLLDPATRAVYARLAVFGGPFTLQAAQAVAADAPGMPGGQGVPGVTSAPVGVDAWAVLGSLATLVDVSLVVAIDAARQQFRLLESPRLHALGQLQARGEEAWCRRRLLAWWQQCVEVADADALLQAQGPLRASLEWALGGGDVAGGSALARRLAAHPVLAHPREAVSGLRPEPPDADLQHLLQRFQTQAAAPGGAVPTLDPDALLQLARRLRPDELRDVEGAMRELARAADIAAGVLQAGPAGVEGGAADTWVDGVLHRIAEHTRQGQFDRGLDEVDEALADLLQREQRQRQQIRQARGRLLQAAVQQELLRRDAFAVARRTEALLALDDAERPTWTAAWLEREQQALDDGQRQMATLSLSVGIEMARRRLDTARTPDERSAASLALAQGLRQRGEREVHNTSLEEAVRVGRAALDALPPDADPQDAGDLQHALAHAMSVWGARSSDTALLEEAVLRCTQALTVRTRARLPMAWAASQHVLGLALRSLGARDAGSQRLEAAEEALRAALLERTAKRAPLDRGRTLGQLGVVLSMLARRDGTPDRRRAALVLYDEALRLLPRDEVPMEWAVLCSNLGIEHLMIAGFEDELAHYRESARWYRAALSAQPRESMPQQWARTQHNLAMVLAHLGTQEARPDLLRESIASYRQVAQVFTFDREPMAWAAGRHEMGTALMRLGALTPGDDGVQAIVEGLSMLQEALAARPHERLPLDWANTWSDVVNARFHWARRTGDRAQGAVALDEARHFFDRMTGGSAPEMQVVMRERMAQIQAWLDRGAPVEGVPPAAI